MASETPTAPAPFATLPPVRPALPETLMVSCVVVATTESGSANVVWTSCAPDAGSSTHKSVGVQLAVDVLVASSVAPSPTQAVVLVVKVTKSSEPAMPKVLDAEVALEPVVTMDLSASRPSRIELKLSQSIFSIGDG